MRALLMDPASDFDPRAKPGPEAPALAQDLALDPLLAVMSDGDPVLEAVARAALLAGAEPGVIRYRQQVLRDALGNAEVIRALYALTLEATDRRHRPYLGITGRYAGGTLYGAIQALSFQAGMLEQLRGIADRHAGRFESRGLAALVGSARAELADDYLAEVRAHLARLEFRSGVLLSAELGEGNAGSAYVLRRPAAEEAGWLRRLLGPRPPVYTFHLPARDEAGARMLTEIRDRGINEVANAAAQAAEHVLAFFEHLKTELAFYVGCMNLHRRLMALGVPTVLPEVAPRGSRRLAARGLYDPGLALTLGHAPVGNDVAADGKAMVVVTGANQGGKSSFLRALGLAQLMLRAGMFVAAEAFGAEPAERLLTHFVREEDAGMTRGRLDDELARLDAIVERLRPGAMLLLNESFAGTNEREGSALAVGVVKTLADSGVRLVFVTHLHQFARELAAARRPDTLFLRAERLSSGARTYRILPGEPLATGYGEDLYREVFPDAPVGRRASA
jgi:hypothetical protein